jgi:hypothetical protein
MKQVILRLWMGVLLWLALSGYATVLPQNDDQPHPMSVHYSPKHVAGFIGLELGGGLTSEPKSAFNMSIHGGATFYYKDMQKELLNSVLGFFLNTSLYAGIALNYSFDRIAWGPKIGIAQLLGPIIIGLEASVYTPNNFREYDVRLYPFFGVSLLNIFSLTVGPARHVGGTPLAHVSSWRAYFIMRMPIELVRYFMSL